MWLFCFTTVQPVNAIIGFQRDETIHIMKKNVTVHWLFTEQFSDAQTAWQLLLLTASALLTSNTSSGNVSIISGDLTFLLCSSFSSCSHLSLQLPIYLPFSHTLWFQYDSCPCSQFVCLCDQNYKLLIFQTLSFNKYSFYYNSIVCLKLNKIMFL